jgi:hypothetical protein
MAVLPPGEPDDQRPVAVMLGLGKAGKFSGRAESLGKLGTLRNVRSTVILDYQGFEAVCAGFP